MRMHLLLKIIRHRGISLTDADGKVYLEVEFEAPLFGIWSPAKTHLSYALSHGMEEVTEKILTIFWKTGVGNELEPGDIF